MVGTIVARCNNEVAIKISTLKVAECPGMKVLHCMVSDMGVPDITFWWLLIQAEQGYMADFLV